MEHRSGPVRQGPWRIHRRYGAVGLTFVLAFIPMTLAEALDLGGFVTTNFFLSTSESGETTTDFQSFNSTLDLTWNRRVSSLFQFRTTLRGQYNTSRTEVDSEVTDSWRANLEPIFDLTLSGLAYSLNAGIRTQEQINDGNRIERIRSSQPRVFTRFSLTPEGLPSLFFLFDRLTIDAEEVDPGITIEDRVETRFDVSTEYAFEDVNLFLSFFNKIDDDKLAGVTRDQKNLVGTVAYSDSFFQDRLDVDADFTVDYTNITEEFSVPSGVDVPRDLQRGLRAAPDPTPEDSSDFPLTPAPGLVSGTANIPLELQSSVGFELVASESVSRIQISLAPEPPFVLPDNLAAFLNFRVFFTNDTTLTTWTEVAGGVSQSFNPIDNVFTLTFASTTARSFKAYVSRNDFGTLVTATGIVAFGEEQVFSGEERVRKTLIGRFGTDLTYIPVDWVTGTVNILLTNTENDPGSNRTTTGNLTARVTAELHRLLTGTLTYQHTFSDSNQPGSEDTSNDTFTLIFTSSPLPTLTSSLSLAHVQDRTEGALNSRSTTVSLNALAQLYRNLNLDSTFSLARNEDFMPDQESTIGTVSLNASAFLTEKFSSTLGFSFSRRDTEGAIQDEITNTLAATGTFTYTLSRLLNFNASLNFTDTEDTTTFGQLYKLDWIPTSKVSSFIEYARIDASGDATGSDSVTVQGTWNISRYFNTNVRFVFFRSFAGDTSQSFNANVQFRF